MLKVQEIQERIKKGEDLKEISEETGTPMKFMEEIKKQFLAGGHYIRDCENTESDEIDEARIRSKCIKRVTNYMANLDSYKDLNELKEIKLKLDITKTYLNMTKENIVEEDEDGELAKMFYEKDSK